MKASGVIVSCKTLSAACAILLSMILASHAVAESRAARQVASLEALPDRPPAPDFTFADTQGRHHSLSGYRGQIVVINFWATWCSPCRREMPSLQRLWEQLRERGGMMLAVNDWDDSPEDITQFFKTMAVDFPILLGRKEELMERWPIRGLPTTYIVDPEGRVAYKVEGDLEWDAPAVIEKILALQSSR
jgi:peroxiredoxin